MLESKTILNGHQELQPTRTTPPKPLLSRFTFNISHDNLRPFVNSAPSPRTPPRRSTYLQSRKQHQLKLLLGRSQACQDRQLQNPLPRGFAHSPDVLREASNAILKPIELKGVGCVWDEVEETRSKCVEEEQWPGKEVWSEPRTDKSSSNASTNDQYSSYYPHYQQSYPVYYKQSYYQPSSFQIEMAAIESDQRTTLMIKNIPNKYTIQLLAEEIDRQHPNCYDFLYLPCDIKNNCNVGYGFINFVSTEALRYFYERFQDRRWGRFKSEKICRLTYARLQGLGSLIEHFQNSKVLNCKDKKYQPIIRERSAIDCLIQLQKDCSPAAHQ